MPGLNFQNYSYSKKNGIVLDVIFIFHRLEEIKKKLEQIFYSANFLFSTNLILSLV